MKEWNSLEKILFMGIQKSIFKNLKKIWEFDMILQELIFIFEIWEASVLVEFG